MMERQTTERELFVMISLDEYVPQDHLLRAVDRYLDLSGFHQTFDKYPAELRREIVGKFKVAVGMAR
jgi:hypothetical protein